MRAFVTAVATSSSGIARRIATPTASISIINRCRIRKIIDNDNKAPNYTKYEAQLVAQFTTRRRANMSCMGAQGVVNHWDQLQNRTWFG